MIGHLKDDLADKMFGNIKLNMKPNPAFTSGMSDDDHLNDEVRRILLLYGKYRYDREELALRETGKTPPNDKDWKNILKESTNFFFFRDEIEKFVAEWYSNNPGSGGGGGSGASGAGGGGGGGGGKARSANGESVYAPFSDDFIEAKFNQLKRRFSGNTDEEIHAVILNLLDDLRRENRTRFPEFTWNKYIMEAKKLEDFESVLKGGLGGFTKSFAEAHRHALREERRRALDSSTSSSGEEEEGEEMEEELPHYSPHYPPPSPSGSASQSSQFQPFGAPAEAFASLRL